jgi:endonuclease-3
MTNPQRTSRFAELFEILQRHYQPVLPDPNRSVFELLLFGCCLEDAPYDQAEDSFARLQQDFFDWNEVRVSTVRELSEVFSELPEPTEAAQRLKRVLQSIFEATYSFDLESLRRQTLGQAEESLKKIDGTTPFTMAYVLQAALGGHVIPLDRSTLQVLELVGLATPEEVQQGVVSGLQRAVPKAQGLEFASLLHQWGAAFKVNPFAPAVRQILLEIEPRCAERLPQRRTFYATSTPAPEVPLGTTASEKKRRGRRAKSAQGATSAGAAPAAGPAETKPAKKRGRRKKSAAEDPQDQQGDGKAAERGASDSSNQSQQVKSVVPDRRRGVMALEEDVTSPAGRSSSTPSPPEDTPRRKPR